MGLDNGGRVGQGSNGLHGVRRVGNDGGGVIGGQRSGIRGCVVGGIRSSVRRSIWVCGGSQDSSVCDSDQRGQGNQLR